MLTSSNHPLDSLKTPNFIERHCARLHQLDPELVDVRDQHQVLSWRSAVPTYNPAAYRIGICFRRTSRNN